MKKLFLLSLLLVSLFAKKRVILVAGPESSGSMFIARHIAKTLDWEYHNYLPPGSEELETDNNKVVHFSFPLGTKPYFPDLREILQSYKDYDRKFILTTRDQNISMLSKYRRFRRRNSACVQHKHRSKQSIGNIIKSQEPYMIWNYETMLYLEDTYFDLLYDFLGLSPKKRSIPKEMYDGNKKYIKSPK